MFAAVILAGGAARRVGGASKPALRIGGQALISRVLGAVATASPRVVVGPPELEPMLATGVIRTRESPPGGGPVAAIAAGVAVLPRRDPESVVAVLASDLPFLSPDAIDALRVRLSAPGAAAGQDGARHGTAETEPADRNTELAVLVDDGGRAQWLAGVWRLGSLMRRLDELGDPAGRSMRELTDGLRVASVRPPGPAGPPAWFDCDTEDDLRAAEEWAGGYAG